MIFQDVTAALRHIIAGTTWEGQVFAAGGCVRDMLLGRQSKDIDLVVTQENGGIAFAEWMHEMADASQPVTFPRFGTAKFVWKGWDIEVVMPRTETYADGTRNPDVSFTSLKEDARRRDFTINSLYLNVSTRVVVDYYDGMADIRHGIIRTAMDPHTIFVDDPLRMLRAIRFARRFNWQIDRTLYNTIQYDAEQITRISQERITAELNEIITCDLIAHAMYQLYDTGLMRYVLPEVLTLIGCGQNKYHNSDAFDHTLRVMILVPATLECRLAALFHDIAKPVTKTLDPETGDVHFYKHEDVGATMTEEILRRMKYPNHVTDAVTKVIREHMRLKDSGPQGQYISDKALRKFRTAMGQHVDVTLALMHADNQSHAPAYCQPEQIPGIRARLDTLAVAEPKKVTLPIDGYEVMQELNIPAGKLVGQLLKVVEEAWYENPDLTKEQAFLLIRSEAACIIPSP